jgi:hypothetical protein
MEFFNLYFWLFLSNRGILFSPPPILSSGMDGWTGDRPHEEWDKFGYQNQDIVSAMQIPNVGGMAIIHKMI